GGAVVEAVRGVYNTVQFFRERGQQLGAVVGTFLDALGTIAAGGVAAAATRLEQTMGRLVPVVPDGPAATYRDSEGLSGKDYTVELLAARYGVEWRKYHPCKEGEARPPKSAAIHRATTPFPCARTPARASRPGASCTFTPANRCACLCLLPGPGRPQSTVPAAGTQFGYILLINRILFLAIGG
ncbi:MAG: hypothetical protein JWP58_2698, partial [Hymenobacter sp.]|nr:hypothetical protein [Hymenobacter sp.]